ncbi:centrosomal protein kizuna isoform X3 [Bubalus kerabau]|uniref:centrosomal protein kizuna isoform X3 n=1 Tax=Bubalus carabanensis TaxID=3119969 RepID=UPI00244E9B2F|nr:centrosomal protein kizuna isoform X3 [Bubalus carabanensis]
MTEPSGRGCGTRGASALPSPDYYEHVAHLQQGLRNSEKKRLDLERKLYEYHQSDVCRAKLKYIKLKKYLKEICESEKNARFRNQEYLKQFERIQANITASLEKLQELKIEFETQIKKMQLLSKDSLGKKGELKDEDKEKVVMPAEINSGTAMSRGLYQPATIFMGRQMSAVSGIGDFTIERKSPQPTKNFSIPDPHSHRQTAQSSDVTGSRVVQTPGDTQCLNKSDKIDGKTSLQIGEKTPVTASALSEEEQTHCFEIGSNACQSKSNLSEGKKSAELHSPLWERLSPENRTTDLKCDSSRRSEGSEGEILTREHTEVEEERARPPVSPLSGSESCASENECPQEKPPARKASSDHLPCEDSQSQEPFRKKQEEQEEESLSSSSDLTVSVSEDDLILKSPELQTNLGDTMEQEDGTETLNVIHSEQERDAPSTRKPNCILQAPSTPDSPNESFTNLPAKEFEQAPASGLLRTRSGQHIAALKGHDTFVQEEEVAKLSEVFLVSKLDQRTKATALLKKDLAEEHDNRSAVNSSKSSCSLPSTPSDESEIRNGKPTLWPKGVTTREQEDESREESTEESMAGRMPITETKAYQRLKQSALQGSTHQARDGFQEATAPTSQPPGLKTGSGTFKTKTTHKIASEASFSSSEGSPLSRHENEGKLTTNLKSKGRYEGVESLPVITGPKVSLEGPVASTENRRLLPGKDPEASPMARGHTVLTCSLLERV